MNTSRYFAPLLGVLLLVAAAHANAAPTPERVVSIRVRILPTHRYAELRKEWKAYTDAHPREALGWAQLARASMYSGVPAAEFIPYAERAVRLDPNSAEANATLGRMRWGTYYPGQPERPDQAIRLLERALVLDPRMDDAHYLLWTMRLSQGRVDEANEHLRVLLDNGRMPEPLVDYAHNMLVGLDPNAIVLTNGDNDTYPLVALQTARKFRTDVTVVNLSLLNLSWYRQMLRAELRSVPVSLLESSTEPAHSWAQSTQAARALLSDLAKSGWKRPLYVAVTVANTQDVIPNRLSLEGLVYRVLPSVGGDNDVDVKRASRNLDERYRLTSIESLSLDWNAWSALHLLMLNYCAVAMKLAGAQYEAGDVAGMSRRLDWMLRVMELHGPDAKAAREWIGYWEARDPKSPAFARWKAKFAN